LTAPLATGLASLAALAGDRLAVTLTGGLPLTDFGWSVRAVTLPLGLAVVLADLAGGLAGAAFDVARPLAATAVAAKGRAANGLAAADLDGTGLTAAGFCGTALDATSFVGAGLTALTGTTLGRLDNGPLTVALVCAAAGAAARAGIVLMPALAVGAVADPAAGPG